jgi:hypothetical protein
VAGSAPQGASVGADELSEVVVEISLLRVEDGRPVEPDNRQPRGSVDDLPVSQRRSEWNLQAGKTAVQFSAVLRAVGPHPLEVSPDHGNRHALVTSLVQTFGQGVPRCQVSDEVKEDPERALVSIDRVVAEKLDRLGLPLQWLVGRIIIFPNDVGHPRSLIGCLLGRNFVRRPTDLEGVATELTSVRGGSSIETSAVSKMDVQSVLLQAQTGSAIPLERRS